MWFSATAVRLEPGDQDAPLPVLRAAGVVALSDGLRADAVETVVFGRITPEQKRDLVAALTRRGRYVAMIGDGVNDVLALKEARLAIAMGLAIVIVERQGRGGVRWWVWGMVGGFALVFTVGLLLRPLRTFFEVSLPSVTAWAATDLVALTGIVVFAMVRMLRIHDPRKRR